jgi:hypothetical protein
MRNTAMILCSFRVRANKKGRELFYLAKAPALYVPVTVYILLFALRRVVFQFAHADAGVAYDFYVALSVCRYDFIISLVGEELTDAPALFVSGIVPPNVQYYHVPRVRRVSFRRGHAVAVYFLPAPRLPQLIFYIHISALLSACRDKQKSRLIAFTAFKWLFV